MISTTLSVGSICFAVMVSAVSPQSTYLLPQQRSEGASVSVVEKIPSGSFEYQIVPSNEYVVATVKPTELSIMDYVLSPVTAVISLSSTAVSLVPWLFINGSMVLLGMGIVIGFCALTTYCTLTIEKPSFLAKESISAIPYFDELEYYISEAYNKYHEMQNSA